MTQDSQPTATGGCDLEQLADRVPLLGRERPMLAGDTSLNGSFDATEVGWLAKYASDYDGPAKLIIRFPGVSAYV
jgi:hypothetical protein